MSGKVVKQGLALYNNGILGIMTSGAWYVGLFTTNYTPVVTDTLSVYTAIEASWAGYSRQILNTTPVTSWDAVNSQYVNQFLAIAFTYTGGSTSGNNYGYFVIDPFGNLNWAELLGSPAPYNLSPSAPTLTINPILDTLSQY
jgi:hypothetical protein